MVPTRRYAHGFSFLSSPLSHLRLRRKMKDRLNSFIFFFDFHARSYATLSLHISVFSLVLIRTTSPSNATEEVDHIHFPPDQISSLLLTGNQVNPLLESIFQ